MQRQSRGREKGKPWRSKEVAPPIRGKEMEREKLIYIIPALTGRTNSMGFMIDSVRFIRPKEFEAAIEGMQSRMWQRKGSSLRGHLPVGPRGSDLIRPPHDPEMEMEKERRETKHFPDRNGKTDVRRSMRKTFSISVRRLDSM